MKYYAKIEDAEKGSVSIGTGSNHAFYTAIGMSIMDVEQSNVDGAWYVAGHAPKKSDEAKQREEAEDRIAELQDYLKSTDWYAVRYAETKVAVPEDVGAKRQAAREEIDELRSGISS